MALAILKAEMKFNKYYGVLLKAKPLGALGHSVTRMLNYKDTTEKHEVQKQAKPFSGLTWQQIPGFSQHKMNFLQHARNNITRMWQKK